MQKGTINVQTENIFPIIKKFLYTDHEIFLRELVANAVDATTKLKTLALRGEPTGEIGDTTIEVILDKEHNRLIVSDKGIGMTGEEVTKYLNQIAFSSAAEFLETYQDAGIIGHFGLGFYSAFMVADKVEVETKSWKADSEAVKWTCAGDPEFTLEKSEKRDRGTAIILHINEENKGFLEESRIEELLGKYCRFLPVPIQFGRKTEYETVGEGDAAKEESREVPNIINDTHPIWKKSPSELTAEDYRKFYADLYPLAAEPMFWIHLNIDHPFNLTGILYFPKVGGALEVQRNKIHLYSNQVFVTDDVREIVPEWLLLLHGVIDSPDIPLNVSRSSLQSDRNVKMISEYVTRKVADKLAELFKNDRPAFEEKWRDLGLFIKFGAVSDPKFGERANAFTLLENVGGQFFLLDEYREKIKATQTDKHNRLVGIYTQSVDNQDAYIRAAQNRGYDVLKMDAVLDNHWMQHLEHTGGKHDLTFVRVDSDTVDNLVQKDEAKTSVLSEAEQAQVKTIFEETVKLAHPGAQVQLVAMTPEDMPVQITRPEFMRRMKEMQAMQGGGMADFFANQPEMFNVVVNSNHPAITQKLVGNEATGQGELAEYLLDLALLNQGMLKGEALTKFVSKALGKL